MKIIVGLSAEQDGGPCIDTIEHLNHVLSFADHGSAGTVEASLRIHLHFLQWLTRFQGLVPTLRLIQERALLSENFPDRACGARRHDLLSGKLRVAMQGGKNGAGSGRALSGFQAARCGSQ